MLEKAWLQYVHFMDLSVQNTIFTLDSIGFVMFPYLRCPRYELSPALPLWTLVPLLERCLVGRPAAVLMVEPEADETNPFLHVSQPVGCNVDAAG